jgi:uncharacterized protein
MQLRNSMVLVCAASLGAMLLAVLPSIAADYSPLNCGTASSVSERTICDHYGLGQLEARMATLYQWSTSFVGMGERGNMQDGQRIFIHERDACGPEVRCLREVYEARIERLQGIMKRVEEKGPF